MHYELCIMNYAFGSVSFSHSARIAMASSRHVPHISSMGRKEPHTFGRSGDPKILQRNSLSNWMHGTPAGLPFGMPGIGDDIDGAMQHAPQPGRQFIFKSLVSSYCTGHSYFDKKLHGSVEVVVVRQRDSVAKRHRTECDTIVTPRKRPEWRAAWGETPP